MDRFSKKISVVLQQIALNLFAEYFIIYPLDFPFLICQVDIVNILDFKALINHFHIEFSLKHKVVRINFVAIIFVYILKTHRSEH